MVPPAGQGIRPAPTPSESALRGSWPPRKVKYLTWDRFLPAMPGSPGAPARMHTGRRHCRSRGCAVPRSQLPLGGPLPSSRSSPALPAASQRPESRKDPPLDLQHEQIPVPRGFLSCSFPSSQHASVGDLHPPLGPGRPRAHRELCRPCAPQ